MAPSSARVSLQIGALIAIAQPMIAGGPLKWSELPPIPDSVGLAAPFAGVSGEFLLVAGGANFPKGAPWEGGEKAWHSSVYCLRPADRAWRLLGHLPRPLAYGIAISTTKGLLCIGGSDGKEHHANVFLLRVNGGELSLETMPALPHRLANGAGALVDSTVYVAGGIDTPDSTNAMRNFWALDLAGRKPAWKELEPWPGPGRMLAVAGAYKSDFYLFSGVDLSGDDSGKPVRHYLRDAYRYHPGVGWSRLADLPRAAVAAPSPAIARGNQLLIVSGDDGSRVNFEPRSKHPGFPRDVLAFDPRRNQWENLGESPLSRATVPVVNWGGRAVIPNGEVRPGVRTPEVWTLETK